MYVECNIGIMLSENENEQQEVLTTILYETTSVFFHTAKYVIKKSFFLYFSY